MSKYKNRNIFFLKNILLLVILLFIKHSIAQEVPMFHFFTPGVAKDTVVQSTTIATFGGDIPNLAKDTAVQSTIHSDSLGSALKFVNKTGGHSTLPFQIKERKIVPSKIEAGMRSTQKTDTIYLLEMVKPQITQSAITFDVGEVFSTFKFIDDQGNKTNFTNNITGCFSLGYQYINKNGLFILTNIGMRKAGASIVYDGLNVNWTIQYALANIGLGYMLNKRRFKPYFSASPYFGYMLKGNQIIGIDNLDIREQKSMKTTDFGLYFSPGFKIALSSYVACTAQYNYILGLQNLETSTGGKQSYNRGFSFNLGIAITIEKYHLSVPTVLPKNGHKVKDYLKNKE